MEKLDKTKYLKRVIIVCWIALAICFGIKLFGGNLFEIMCENENFIKVCDYADNHLWADYLISLVYGYITNYFFILAICGKWKFNNSQLIIFSIAIILGCLVKLFSTTFGMIFDIWQTIIMPCLFTIKNPKRHIWVIVGNILFISFQMISLFVKNLSLEVVTNNGLLVGMIYCIDVAIMIFLYYLYVNFKSKRKED